MAFVVVLASAAHSQLTPLVPASARSSSGQFVIHGAPRPGIAVPDLGANTNLFRLELTLLTISCERIKQILYRELETTAPWNSKIFLALYPSRTLGEPVTITSERFADGWQYRVDLPDVLDRAHYVRALVQVLLVEMANRHPSGRSAEIPTWLIEGLTQQILASSQIQNLV